MTLISFQHSIKYIFVQLAPYAVLAIAAAYMAAGLNFLWFMAYLSLSGLLVGRFIKLASVQYFFTHDMLIVSRGVIFKTVDCRPLWQLKGMQVRHNHNCLLRWLHILHIDCGLQGPPAGRIRIVGVDASSMLKIFEALNEGIDINTEMWRNHFQQASA
jgi:hypothetical protein